MVFAGYSDGFPYWPFLRQVSSCANTFTDCRGRDNYLVWSMCGSTIQQPRCTYKSRYSQTPLRGARQQGKYFVLSTCYRAFQQCVLLGSFISWTGSGWWQLFKFHIRDLYLGECHEFSGLWLPTLGLFSPPQHHGLLRPKVVKPRDYCFLTLTFGRRRSSALWTSSSGSRWS